MFQQEERVSTRAQVLTMRCADKQQNTSNKLLVFWGESDPLKKVPGAADSALTDFVALL